MEPDSKKETTTWWEHEIRNLPHTFASTMKELEALLALNNIELNFALEPYKQFDSSRKGSYRALQSVTILIFVLVLHGLHVYFHGPSYTAVLHRLTATDQHNCCLLLPDVLIFLEWYVGMIDYAKTCDEDEKVSNAKSYFLGALVYLVSGFEENLHFANQIAMWEYYELRGFEHVSQSNEILDFCIHNRGKFECRNSIRVNRVLHAPLLSEDKSS
ncbi:hypothetical protein L1887_23913 [Cichorium endivia]|nr:hypothetical protein L1887_23913 [Cichorium endivia]